MRIKFKELEIEAAGLTVGEIERIVRMFYPDIKPPQELNS